MELSLVHSLMSAGSLEFGPVMWNISCLSYGFKCLIRETPLNDTALLQFSSQLKVQAAGQSLTRQSVLPYDVMKQQQSSLVMERAFIYFFLSFLFTNILQENFGVCF